MDNNQDLTNEKHSSGNSEGGKIHPTTEMIQHWITEQLAAYLKMSPDMIDQREPTSRYGVDSSVAVTLTGELADWLGLKLDPTLFWEYPTIESVAQHVAQECQKAQSVNR